MLMSMLEECTEFSNISMFQWGDFLMLIFFHHSKKMTYLLLNVNVTSSIEVENGHFFSLFSKIFSKENWFCVHFD